MNGIDPPTPMSTGSVPHDCANAHRAACIAGESVGAWNGLPFSPSVTVTRAPKGAFADEVRPQRVHRGVRVLTRCETDGELGRRARRDRVRRARHARGVEPDDADRRAGPQPGR